MSEIELLERVLLRLGCTDTDEQLQSNILKFLPPVLEKITSPQEAVRLKVMEVLTHINKRLKARPNIQVPVRPILELYMQTESSYAMNFSIIYITMGFPRMPLAEQSELVPQLLSSLHGKPEVHQDKLLTLVVPLLGAIKIPDDPAQRHTLLNLSEHPATQLQLITFLQDALLFPYGLTQDMDVPPGMSVYSFKRIASNGWKAEELEEFKKGIVRFLASGVFGDDDVLVPLIVASADTRFSVATPALAELNKICITIDWTKAKLTEPLYVLFSGSNNHPVKDKRAKATNVRVRQKLLQYLLKCKKSGVHEVRGLQVIFEALFGEQTNQKCKVGALQFCENMIREGDRVMVGKLAKVLFDGINKLLANGNDESQEVQNAAYSALSQLLSTCPEIIKRDLQLVSRFFKILTEAPVDLQESVKDVLQAMAPAFNHEQNDKATETLLMALLTDLVGTKANIVKKVVITYLTTCFPEHHIAARFVLLLLLEGEEKSSLRELIMNSLYGVPKKDNLELRRLVCERRPTVAPGEEQEEEAKERGQPVTLKVLPAFSGMASYCFQEVEKRTERLNVKDGIVFSVDIHEEILYYLRVCLWVAAGLKAPPQFPNGSHQLKQFVADNFKGTPGMRNYVQLVKHVLYKRRSYVPLSCLFDIFNSVPELIEEEQLGHDLVTAVLENGLKDVTEDTRSIIGQLYGLVVAYKCPDEEFDGIIQRIVTSNGVSLEHQHGSYLAASYAVQQRVRKMRREGGYDDAVAWKALQDLVLCFMAAIKESHPMILSSAIKGISFISQETRLPIPAENPKAMEVEGGTTATKPVATMTSKEDLLNGLLKLIAGNSTKQKLREEACDCLASLTFCDGAFFTKPILQRFLKLNRLTKDPAIHIAMGQTIVKIILGANEILDVFDEEGKMQVAGAEDKFPDADLDWLLLELVELVNKELHPYSRQMACIWLLGIVKSCSQRELIRRRRELLQLAFTELLTEDNELVQDVASRGLGELYAFSEDAEQSELAHSLLDQLTGKPAVKKVTADTKVFEEGTLGKTPTGDSLSTYKDLCALATDMNKPEMIYQFMQLANHNATWNNKLGAAFGLRSISKAAKVNMTPHLVKIVPRLFRYRYDPTPKVQHSMASIWDSLVVNTKETVDLYYWEILADLNRNLTSNEWRTRISCCLGARDIIKLGIRTRGGGSRREGSPSTAMEVDEETEIEEELLELWRQLFRVMDDVHEGTRLAAEGTATMLSKACLVASSSDHGKAGKRVVCTVLPFLLESGVTNIVPEIRRVSLKLVSDLIENAGEATISQHMVQMVPCLLQATGDSEGNKLSYLSTRYGGQEDVQEAVDNLRAEAAKHQSTTQAMTKCIRYISYPLLEQMTPQILDLMRSSVTLGTKIACAHFVCLVSIRLGAEMTPLAAKYINACTTGLGDRNATVRRYMASSIGHLVGIAKEQTVLKLMQKLLDFYEDRQSSKSLIVPVVVQAMNKRYPEILKDYSAQVLPLIFFAMHEVVVGEDNRATIELWTELWNDVSPGEAGIRMNLDSIVPKLVKYLDESSWVMKAQAANAIKTLADKLGAAVSDEEREGLMRPLLKEMSGRTFDGKEKLLQALASLCKVGYKKERDAELTAKIIDAMMRECRKEEPTYRTHALRSTGDILQALQVDRFEEVYNMVWHLLDRSSNSSDDGGEAECTAEERSKKATTSLLLRETVCETLGKAWPVNALDTQRKYQLRFVEKCVECLMKNTRPVQLSLLIALGRFLERLKIFEGSAAAAGGGPSADEADAKKAKVDDQEGDEEAVLEKICNLVMKCVEDVSTIPHTGLKKESLTIVLVLMKKLQKRPNSQKHAKAVKGKLETLLENFRKDHAPEIKCRLLDVEAIMKTM